MPCRLISVPGTAFFMSQTFQATMDSNYSDDSALWDFRFCYERRSIRTRTDDCFTFTMGMWPNRTAFVSDPAIPCSLIEDRDSNAFGNAAVWDTWWFGFGGCASTKYIMGQCKNSVGTPLGGCVVQGFRTRDDMYIGETTSNDQGLYELACPNTPTDQHYLVAYYDSATDLAGTTVNTLVPTNRDGT